MQDKYIVAKYLRISSDDGTDIESNSIKNQRDLLDFHIKKTFTVKDIDAIELIDDGYTGTNMLRPSMKKLLILAETNEIDCIVVKDFSRFARDYIDVGMYLEQKFPEWQIRFISVNDNYDSNDYRGITSGIHTALKNLVYAMYSKDLSEKIKSARRVRYKKGEFLSPFAFYGYKKDPNNKNHIIIDAEAAMVVRKIFDMKVKGLSSSTIAIALNKEGILTPAMYKKSQDPLCRSWNNVSDFKSWSATIIINILRNERYTGKMISGKSEHVAVGSKKCRLVKKENLIVVENTHEPIISKKIFNTVKKINQNLRTPQKSKFSLDSLLRCGGCKHVLSKYGKKNGMAKYFCSYKRFTEKNDCIEGKITENDICELLFEIIKQQIKKSVDINNADQKLQKKAINFTKIINDLYNKIEMYKQERLKEYMKLSKGELTEIKFEENRDKINKLIFDVEEKINAIQIQPVSNENITFLTNFQKYVGIEELNREIVTDLIKTIYIYPDKRIEIVWKCCENSE